MWSFAMSKLPAGQLVPVPRDLGKLITTTARNPNDGADPEELEQGLVQALATVSMPDKACAGPRFRRR